jgi:DNA polymerase elongation subunit (family B)
MTILQPCDWIESDSNFKYVVDVFGRTETGDIAKLRITGFHPYFYLKARDGETSNEVSLAIQTAYGKNMKGLVVTQEFKLDAMRGFASLTPVKVWKISCTALWMFKNVAKILKDRMKLKKLISDQL